MYRNVSQCIAMYRNVSQCIAMYRNVSQCTGNAMYRLIAGGRAAGRRDLIRGLLCAPPLPAENLG
jgi:hypothetical protein